ncbi:hypothetical protein BS47DRAFT_1423917 [Hydnum rufescens UP504]|uniref:NAD-dependent epimerase/dehydratase domain-containing protein n=1 Tax=Hydnum rufescens UP504 TaxID=1448309 RepID=A0A9P6AJX2_9AGAM|nr:hypothetical protein BS47DRAFT_1423917 [Hydnum rufescens UP504]
MSFLPTDLILVTGANGHLAQHVVDQLLALPNPPRVRGTVRSLDKATPIFKHYPRQVDQGLLEIVVVEDITTPGAFDEAIKGATHLAHVAAPISTQQNDIETDILQPAIAGTTSALETALHEPSVRKVVVTSTFASCVDPSKGWRPDYTHTEADFNPLTREDAINTDLSLPNCVPLLRPWVPYMVAKLLAEKAAWEIASRPDAHFGLTVCLPTYIFGPSILPLEKGAGSLNYSNGVIWSIANAQGAEHMPIVGPQWADVRDVARAHVLALSKKEVDGQRFLLYAGPYYNSDIAEIVKKHFPTLSPSTGPSQKFDHYRIDNSKSINTLGLGSYISLEQSVIDTLIQILAQERKPQDSN